MFQGLSGSAHRRSKRTPVGIYLQPKDTNLIGKTTLLFIKEPSRTASF